MHYILNHTKTFIEMNNKMKKFISWLHACRAVGVIFHFMCNIVVSDEWVPCCFVPVVGNPA